MSKKAYATAAPADQHLQKADYCRQQAAIARLNGNIEEAEKYEKWAQVQFELSAKNRKTESKPREQA